MGRRRNSWRDVPFSLHVEASPETIGEELFQEVRDFVKSTGNKFNVFDELYIEGKSTGYYDEGRCTGPVDDCYPPEGDDERVVDNIEALSLPQSVSLPHELAEEIFVAVYDSHIVSADLDGD